MGEESGIAPGGEENEGVNPLGAQADGNEKDHSHSGAGDDQGQGGVMPDRDDARAKTGTEQEVEGAEGEDAMLEITDAARIELAALLRGLGDSSVESADDVGFASGYMPSIANDITPTLLMDSVTIGKASLMTEDGIVPVVIMRITTMCLQCESVHPAGVADVMLPMELGKFMREGLGQVLDGTLRERADEWMDGELEKMTRGDDPTPDTGNERTP